MLVLPDIEVITVFTYEKMCRTFEYLMVHEEQSCKYCSFGRYTIWGLESKFAILTEQRCALAEIKH